MIDKQLKELIEKLERLEEKWINKYYKGEAHIDVTECADELGVLIEDIEVEND